MKKYIIFVVSFIFLFAFFQILSGIFLTYMYTPNVDEAWNSTMPAQETTLEGNGSFILTLFTALLSATIAYFIPKKLKS